MLTYKQIIKAITDKLLEKFEDIPVIDSDVEEGFERPSFFVSLDNITRDDRKYYSIKSMTCRILYFPSNRNRYTLEFMDVQETLESSFNLTLSIQDRVITIDETRTQTIGETTQTKVLEFEFDFTYYENNQTDDTGLPMQELSLDV